MPQRSSSKEPPPVMTWSKALPVLCIAIVDDALRIFFEGFLFFGPALATLYCTAEVNGALQTWTAGILGAKTAALACTAAVGGTIVGATAITGGTSAAVIGMFGVVMAMAVGFIGWLMIGGIMLVSNSRIFKKNSLWFAGSLLISEVPILSFLPAMSVTVWRMYRTQIKTEKAEFKKWKKDQAAADLQERNMRALQIQQVQAAQQQAMQKAQYIEDQDAVTEAEQKFEGEREADMMFEADQALDSANADTYTPVRKAA